MKRFFIQYLAIVFGIVSLSVYAVNAKPEHRSSSVVAVTGATHYQLKNGLRITFLPLGHKPSATVHLHVDAGHLWDSKKWGMSNLSFLLSQAVNAREYASEYSYYTSSYDGKIRSSVGVDRSALRVSLSSEQVKMAIDDMADIVMRRNVPQAHFDIAKTSFIRDIEIAFNSRKAEQKQGFFTHLVSHNISNDYEKLKESVVKIKREDLAVYIHSTWVAKRMHIFVVGAFKEQAVLKQIEAAFINLPAGTAAPEFSHGDVIPPLSVSLYKQRVRGNVGDFRGFESKLLLGNREIMAKDDLQYLLLGLSLLPPLKQGYTSRLPPFNQGNSTQDSITSGRELVVDQLVNFVAFGLPQQTLPQYIKRASTILPKKCSLSRCDTGQY